MSGWMSKKVDEIVGWARASALRYFVVRGGCCADEFTQAVGARYNLERFGALPEVDHRRADVLVVLGAISEKAAPALRQIHEEMPRPGWVVAAGSCACTGGLFAPHLGGSALPGVSSVIPVDVFVPGCPPRPEALIDGWILLQEKIRGFEGQPEPGRRRAPRDPLLENGRGMW